MFHNSFVVALGPATVAYVLLIPMQTNPTEETKHTQLFCTNDV